MQRLSAILVTALVLFASAALAQEKSGGEKKAGGEKKSPMTTITGTVVDTKCYAMSAENFGDQHGDMPGCGAACANMGIPVGVVKDGKKGDPAVILLAPAKGFASVMGKTVRVNGTSTWNGAAIIPTKVEVQDEKGNWTEVKTKSMM
jgi:hypothetical protein